MHHIFVLCMIYGSGLSFEGVWFRFRVGDLGFRVEGLGFEGVGVWTQGPEARV